MFIALDTVALAIQVRGEWDLLCADHVQASVRDGRVASVGAGHLPSFHLGGPERNDCKVMVALRNSERERGFKWIAEVEENLKRVEK